MSAYPIVSGLGEVTKFSGEAKNKIVTAIKSAQEQLDPKGQESLYNQIKMLLSQV